ncbi:DUF58 domain-containing protein [Marispirochaeta sp.]|uniref:DUF58 domain-containing protein n=1 Tax=Marispirochaeta sp. TaxID=2038653 RepID=UPI0029C7CA1E|nr:DUF58 domain-containing protein [Marispirochaeta sp.]
MGDQDSSALSPQQGNYISSIFSLGLSLGLVFLVFFIALVQQNFNLALPAGGVLIIGLGTRLWSRAALFRLKTEIHIDTDRLFPGDCLNLSISLDNHKLLPVIAGLELGTPALLDSGEENDFTGETRLLSFEKCERTWRVRARKRGTASLGNIQLRSGDLLGLHTRQKTLTHSREIIVYPRQGELMPLSIPFQEFFGIHPLKGPVDDPAWYAGTRDYSGDRPARNIHWKASARLGKLQEKLYEPTSHRKVLLAFDASDFSFPEHIDDFEQIIETVGTLAAVLMETGASFGLVTNAAVSGAENSILPIGRGPEHLGHLLGLLARIEYGAAGKMDKLLKIIDRDDLGLVYSALQARESIADTLSEGLPRRRQVLLVFCHTPENDEAGEEVNAPPGIIEPVFWRGFPVYPARELVHVR